MRNPPHRKMRPPSEATSRTFSVRDRIAGLFVSGRHEMPLDRQGFPFLLNGRIGSGAGSIFASKGSQEGKIFHAGDTISEAKSDFDLPQLLGQ